LVLAGVALFGLGLFVRTVVRNPAWFSTFVVLETLNQEHPESYMSVRARGTGLDRVGDREAAREAFDLAVSLAPNHYGMLVEVGEFRGRTGDWVGGEHLLRRAIALVPGRANAYQILASQLLRQERGREGHRVALDGLARVGSDRELWALVSESYILKGDLPAAVRAREAALAADPASSTQWGRLGELLSAMGEVERAEAARERARVLEESIGKGREGQ
jgi:tetratricopeptide (TPR) repeat protein